MTHRRSFLATAGATAVYTLAGDAPKAKAAGPNDKVGLGFIGVGVRGSGLIDDFRTNPATRFVVAADLYDGYLQHAKEATGGQFQTTKRYEDVLNRKDIDAVVIAVPDHWHKRMTLAALAAGKHVYIEKPLTLSLDEGPEIIAAEKKYGKTVMVGSGAKTTAIAQKVKELIASNAIGKVSLIRMVNYRNSKEGAWIYPIPPDASPKTIDWERFLGSAPKRDFSPEHFFRWRCWWEYSGGVATDLFVHLLTTLHEVMGVRAPASVVSQGGLWFWKDGRTVPDVLESAFEYKEGFIAQMCVHLKSSAPAPPAMFFGSEGTLTMNYNSVVVQGGAPDDDVQKYGTYAWPKEMREAYFRSKGVDPANPKSGSKAPEPKQIRVERGPSHTDFFLESVREGKPSREPAIEGHAAAGAAHLANQAYREGRKLKWDFDKNKVS